MFEADNIRDWREHDVVDLDGSKIGQLEAVYVDTGTDLPMFASVKIGMIGRHRPGAREEGILLWSCFC
jgi:hypothetical protein